MSTNGRTVPETVVLGPREDAPGRPFTSVGLTGRDMSILLELLADVRGVLREVDAGTRTIERYQKLAWKVDGLTHRLIICDEARLRYRERTCVVGFFGERRTDLDPGPLEEANTALVAEFTRYPWILSYSSVELPGGPGPIWSFTTTRSTGSIGGRASFTPRRRNCCPLSTTRTSGSTMPSSPTASPTRPE